MHKPFIYIILLLSIFLEGNAQCPDNLIKNGGFELDTIGENIAGKFWDKLEGVPLIDDSSDEFIPFHVSTTYKYGHPQESEDGGFWQILYCTTNQHPTGDTINTRIGQNVSLQKSVPHVLSFEFASIAFIETVLNTNFSAIDVLIDNELVYTSKLDSTLYSWEKESFSFVPKSKDIFIEFRMSKELNPTFVKYVALDGICLRPVGMGMFCEFD